MTPAFRRRQAGVSLVELMIAITLGLIVLAGLATLFANTSASRAELERSSRQIENGRFAMELLSDDLRLAGFYGELSVRTLPAPGALADPCSTTVADWKGAIPVHLQGYDDAAPGCVPDRVPGTDVIVVRRASACEAGVAGCPAMVNGEPYLQVAKCETETVLVANSYVLDLAGAGTFDRHVRNCTGVAGVRRYLVHIYYVSRNNGNGVAIPTLKRLRYNPTGAGAVGGFVSEPLVEGIDALNLEYGIDWDLDGNPDGYTADPTTYAPAACGANCNPTVNWLNVMTVRVNLLARNIESSPGYTDAKTYRLGRNADDTDFTVTPGGDVRRHAYTTLVRVINAAERRDRP